MNPRHVRITVLMSILFVAAPIHARVIEVGALREAKTIDSAVAKAQVGDEIVLDRGVEHTTKGLRITVDALEFRSADGAGAPAIITNTSTDKNAVTFEHRAEGLMLKDLILSGGGTITCVRAKGRRLTVDNVRPTNTVWRFIHLDGAQQTIIRNCEAPVLPTYSVCSFDHDTRGLLIDHCTFLGSEKEHTIRLQQIYDGTLRDSTFKVGGWKSALTIREGADNRVENCTISGPVSLGPLADANGGINYPTVTEADRARREQLLRRTQRNVTFKNCTIDTPKVTVEMGVQNLVFENCRITTAKTSVLHLARDEYEPWRNIPTGSVIDCALTGPAGLRLFQTDRKTFTVLNTTLNGARLSDVTPPATTKPTDGGSGGAVPGELPPPPPPASGPATAPATLPATRPSVRRFDLIDATSGAVLCELKDGDALPATMPSALNVLVTTEPARVGSVRVAHNGTWRLERTAPYTVGSPSLAIGEGVHGIEAIAFTGDNASGTAGLAARITFTRAAAPAPTPPPATQPSPAEFARAADVVAAIDSLDVALADLHIARQRLAASTQPAAAPR